jgi:hypothetical protein
MPFTNGVASTQTVNNVPVQAQFNAAGVCVGLIGPSGNVFSPPLSGNTENPSTLSIGGSLIASSTLPTLGSGWGTNPTITASNTFGFKIVVGTGGANAGTINFPTAPNGWIVYGADVTNGSSLFLQQTGSTATSATLTSYGITTGTASPMSAGDIILINALAY